MKSDCLGCAVLLCLVTLFYLFDLHILLSLLASFFLPSHLSLKHVHVHVHMCESLGALECMGRVAWLGTKYLLTNHPSSQGWISSCSLLMYMYMYVDLFIWATVGWVKCIITYCTCTCTCIYFLKACVLHVHVHVHDTVCYCRQYYFSLVSHIHVHTCTCICIYMYVYTSAV